jgi:hypothetical protein
MANDVVRLSSGIAVEVVKAPNSQPAHVAGIIDGLPSVVADSGGQITNIVMNVCEPIGNAWKGLEGKVTFEKVEIELTLDFEASGNVFVSKAKGSASLSVKITLSKPQ